MKESIIKMVATRRKNGSYKQTDSQKSKISDSVKLSHKEKDYGFKKGMAIWNIGKHHSEETKSKLSLATKKQLKENGHPFLGKHHSIESLKKISENRKGKSCGKERYNWKGNKPLWRALRTNAQWASWREKVFIRDKYTCQNINCSYCNNIPGVLLHPHHIKQIKDNPELAFIVDNGLTLCSEYHLKGGLHK